MTRRLCGLIPFFRFWETIPEFGPVETRVGARENGKYTKGEYADCMWTSPSSTSREVDGCGARSANTPVDEGLINTSSCPTQPCNLKSLGLQNGFSRTPNFMAANLIMSSARSSLSLEGGLNRRRSTMEPPVPWTEMDAKILERIFSYIDHVSLCRAAKACRYWNMVSERESLWKPIHPVIIQQTRERLAREGSEADDYYIFEPLNPQRWKDASRDTSMYSCLRDSSFASSTPIVVDNGTATFKAGFAGQKLPALEVTSALAFPKSLQPQPFKRNADGTLKLEKFPRFLAGDEANCLEHSIEDQYIISRNISNRCISRQNIDELTRMWAFLFDSLHVDVTERPVLMTTALCSSDSSVQNEMLEILFETFATPAAYIAQAPVLSAYAYAQLTGLVVDIGAAATRIVPIWDGSILDTQSREYAHLGGYHLDTYVSGLLVRDFTLRDRFSMLNGRVVAREIKEQMALCTLQELDVSSPGTAAHIDHQLRMGDYLFAPQEILGDFDDSLISIQQAIQDVVMKCSYDVRLDLVGNILLSGGGSAMVGLPQRLDRELRQLLPASYASTVDVRVITESKYASWSGGAVLASLEDFEDMWHLNDEYFESGAASRHDK